MINRPECKYKEYRNILNKVKQVCKSKYYQDKCVEYKRNTKKTLATD